MTKAQHDLLIAIAEMLLYNAERESGGWINRQGAPYRKLSACVVAVKELGHETERQEP